MIQSLYGLTDSELTLPGGDLSPPLQLATRLFEIVLTREVCQARVVTGRDDPSARPGAARREHAVAPLEVRKAAGPQGTLGPQIPVLRSTGWVAANLGSCDARLLDGLLGLSTSCKGSRTPARRLSRSWTA